MKMSRVLLVASIVALAAPASADRQSFADHGSGGFSFDVVFPAGPGNCDFELEETVVETFKFEENFNLTNFTLQVNNQIVIEIIHSNNDTGYYLTETDRITDRYDLFGTTEADRGIFWNLRSPDGKVVLVGAGRVHYDFAAGTVTATPNTHFDQSTTEIICDALGGSAVPL